MSKFPNESKSIEKCTNGLISKFEGPVQGIDSTLEVINNRQTTITDKLIGENEKFEKVAEEYKMQEMIQKTKLYKKKLEGLKHEMETMTERSSNMNVRAMRLQEAKQTEALKREAKLNQDREREENLIARPAVSK